MNCPRCHLPAEPEGEARLQEEGRFVTLTIFQCPRCLVRAELLGVTCEAAYTFAVRPDGSILDWRSPDVLPGRG